MKAKEKTKILSPNIFPVVGIGASAGGLDAFKKLIKAIPENRLELLLVQHQYQGLMPRLPQKVSFIPEFAADAKANQYDSAS